MDKRSKVIVQETPLFIKYCSTLFVGALTITSCMAAMLSCDLRNYIMMPGAQKLITSSCFALLESYFELLSPAAARAVSCAHIIKAISAPLHYPRHLHAP
jgi:hypothetical protein